MAVEWKKVVLESSSGNVSQNAATATALATARGLQVDLAETDASNFDGTGAVTDIGVSGTLAVTNGGTGIASIPKGSLLQATAADTILPLSGGSGDNGKVVSYNSTTDLFELVATGTATNASNVTVTDNEDTNEENLITFVADAANSTGSHGLEMDGNLTYNPSSGTLTSTNLIASTQVTSAAFVGNLTGNVTGTILTAAQGNITSVGALNGGSITSGFGAIDNGSSAITTTGAITGGSLTGGSLTVDDVAVDGKIITMTGSSGDTATFTAGANGTLDIVTTDGGGAAADIQITADGTAELAGTTVTLDSSGGITLDADGGTITFADGGVSLGTITSSGYSGTAAVATAVTVADESSDTTCNVLFTTAPTGDLAPKSGTNLTFNSSSGVLTATGFAGAFVGDIVGDVTGTASLAAVTNSNTNQAFPVVFNDESNQLLDDTGAFTYNPNSGTLVVPNLTVSGNTTTVQTSTLTVEDIRIVAANPLSNASSDGDQATNATGGGLALNTHLTTGTNDANYAAVTWSATGDLTGWRFRDTAGQTDYAAAVIKLVTNSSASPTAAEAGVGTFHFAQANSTSDGELYLRVQ